MTDVIETFGQTLQQAGYSNTRSRRVVFEALQGQEPLSMHELVMACTKQVDRASVYRTISLFEKLGIVQRLQIGWKYKLELSAAFSHHHHHLTCTSCRQTTPLPEDKQLENRLLRLANKLRFTPQDHQIE